MTKVSKKHIHLLNEVGRCSKGFGAPRAELYEHDPKDIKFCLENGLIEKKPYRFDGRKIAYFITQKGRAVVVAYITDALNRNPIESLL